MRRFSIFRGKQPDSLPPRDAVNTSDPTTLGSLQEEKQPVEASFDYGIEFSSSSDTFSSENPHVNDVPKVKKKKKKRKSIAPPKVEVFDSDLTPIPGTDNIAPLIIEPEPDSLSPVSSSSKRASIFSFRQKPLETSTPSSKTSSPPLTPSADNKRMSTFFTFGRKSSSFSTAASASQEINSPSEEEYITVTEPLTPITSQRKKDSASDSSKLASEEKKEKRRRKPPPPPKSSKSKSSDSGVNDDLGQTGGVGASTELDDQSDAHKLTMDYPIDASQIYFFRENENYLVDKTEDPFRRVWIRTYGSKLAYSYKPVEPGSTKQLAQGYFELTNSTVKLRFLEKTYKVGSLELGKYCFQVLYYFVILNSIVTINEEFAEFNSSFTVFTLLCIWRIFP